MELLQLLFFALALIGFMVFNYAMQRAARRAQARQQHEALQQEAVPLGAVDTAENESLDDVWGRTPQPDVAMERARGDLLRSIAPPMVQTATDARRDAATQREALPRRGRTLGRNLFRSRQALRHAIVSMTVLGPCRALEPYAGRSEGTPIAPEPRSGRDTR